MTPGGYWPSDWPTECGDNHRAKAAPGPGLDLAPTDRLVVTTRHPGRWPVTFVKRDVGQLYLHGTTVGSGADSAGWVERVDPVTLAPQVRSGDLPTGGHEWGGSVAAHANGDLYTVNGSRIHRLDQDCRVMAERALPVDRPHAGLQILADGSIVTKDHRLDGGTSTLTVLDPDLEVLTTAPLPEASAGRLATTPRGGGSPRPGERVEETIYVAGLTRVFRYHWDGTSLSEDPLWRPAYRTAGRGGPAWDPTLADGWLWLMDNGNANGPEPWPEPVRLIGLDTGDAAGEAGMRVIVPTELPGGWVIASPLVHNGVAVAWDTANTGLVAFDVSPGARNEMLWYQPFRSSMQPLLFPATGELVVNDFRHLEDGSTSDDLVVLDLATGRMKARVATGAIRYSGMFLTPGWNRDLYYCTFGTVARVRAESLPH
jgi:hypothetical protein